MAENIKELIEKIQNEGVNIALEKAKKIEEDALKNKEEILTKAKFEAEHLISQAKEQINRIEQASELSLQQTCRNVLLTLKKEINDMLDKIIVLEIRNALSSDELAKIIHPVILAMPVKNSSEIIVHLNKDDAKKIENTFLKGLKEEVAKNVKLQSKEDISGGFIISYDAGKSHFDFTDKALAEYLGVYVKPKLAEILKKAVS